MWLGLQRYPATLVLYALGLGALSGNRLQLLGHLLATEIPQADHATTTVSQLLPPHNIFQGFSQVFGYPLKAMQKLEGMANQHTPLSEWIRTALWQYMSYTAYNSKQYDLAFDKLEILMALSYAYHDDEKAEPWYSYRTSIGSFIYRTQTRGRILREIEESIATRQHESPFVRSGIFGETADECAESIQQFQEFVPRAAQSMGIYG